MQERQRDIFLLPLIHYGVAEVLGDQLLFDTGKLDLIILVAKMLIRALNTLSGFDSPASRIGILRSASNGAITCSSPRVCMRHGPRQLHSAYGLRCAWAAR